MATIHTCDICGNNRGYQNTYKVKIKKQVFDFEIGWHYQKMEICNNCQINILKMLKENSNV